ncbi:DNA polymerase I, partial [Patescibacteria group bacterium]|nr:DNA polymerase I [Patescibacteria group bacterium]
MSKLILIDGNAILHRAYHALPPLTTKRGEPINAVYGFISMLLRVIQDLEPTHIVVAFDRKEPTFRHKEYEHYQAQRPETDKKLISQFDKTKRVVDAFGIPFYDKAGFEADDVIGTLAKQAEKKLDEIVIVTGDKDILQLVTK